MHILQLEQMSAEQKNICPTNLFKLKLFFEDYINWG